MSHAIKPLQLLLDFMLGRPAPASAPPAPPAPLGARRRARGAARRPNYDALVVEMKERYGFRVRRWRRSMSGCAWELRYADGSTRRMLEAPYPKSPISCAIFLHEVGHHAIGLGAVRPRSLEELRAWQWSLAAMEERGLAIDERTRERFRRSMEYAVAKSIRRGVREVPEELRAFLPTGSVRRRSRGASAPRSVAARTPS